MSIKAYMPPQSVGAANSSSFTDGFVAGQDWIGSDTIAGDPTVAPRGLALGLGVALALWIVIAILIALA